MKRLILSTALAVLAAWLPRFPFTPFRFSVPPYRHGQKLSPPIPCHILLPAASHMLLCSLTSDTSPPFHLFVFTLAPLPSWSFLVLHLDLNDFYLKVSPWGPQAISWSWIQTQILLLTICSSAAQSCQFCLSINILRWLRVHWIDQFLFPTTLFFLSLIHLHIVPKLSQLPCFLLSTQAACNSHGTSSDWLGILYMGGKSCVTQIVLTPSALKTPLTIDYTICSVKRKNVVL